MTALRAAPEWIPALSLVGLGDRGEVIAHVVCSRAWIEGIEVVGLGPVGVRPANQGHGVGAALMHAAISAADALDVPVIGLLGDPALYGRFGFVTASSLGIVAPDPTWGGFFQARPLTRYKPTMTGAFRYAAPFDEI